MPKGSGVSKGKQSKSSGVRGSGGKTDKKVSGKKSKGGY